MKYVSLYSGCGGADIGFHRQGFVNIGSFDINQSALKVLHYNLSAPIFELDLSKVEVSEVLGNQKVDVVFSGAPCQGFSTAGNRVFSDPRNSLLIRGGEIALALKTNVFVSENVMGSFAGTFKEYWDKLEFLFRSSGYQTKFVKVNCLDIGMAQMRKRILFFAWKDSARSVKWCEKMPGKVLRDVLLDVESTPNSVDFDSELIGEKKLIANAIKPFQKLSNVRGGDRAVATWEIPEVFGDTSFSEKEILVSIRSLRRKYRKRDFGDADPVDLDLIIAEHGPAAISHLSSLESKGYLVKRGTASIDLTRTFNGKYRRLSYNEPCPTVDTRFGNPTYFLHPTENRGFSVREAARIQGFPDNFIFLGTLEEKYRMIGNAVPPPLSDIVAKIVKDQLLS